MKIIYDLVYLADNYDTEPQTIIVESNSVPCNGDAIDFGLDRMYIVDEVRYQYQEVKEKGTRPYYKFDQVYIFLKIYDEG